MPLPARDLKLQTATNTYSFDLAGPHEIDEQPLGPVGDINFTMDDWSGGLQTIEQGIVYRQTPTYLSSLGADAAFPSTVYCQPQATTMGTHVFAPIKQVDFAASGGVVNAYLIATTATPFFGVASGGGWAAVASGTC